MRIPRLRNRRTASGCRGLLHPLLLVVGGVMVVADDTGYFPGAVFALPEMNELAFANRFCVVMAWVVKAVNAHLHRAITLHVIDPQRRGNEFASDFAANILLDAVG